jgi:hypothetical protein
MQKKYSETETEAVIFAHLKIGDLSEWLKEHAWKVCIPLKGIEGSNPSVSADISQSIKSLSRFLFAGYLSSIFILPDCKLYIKQLFSSDLWVQLLQISNRIFNELLYRISIEQELVKCRNGS